MTDLRLKGVLGRAGLILLAAGFSASAPHSIALGGPNEADPRALQIRAEATSITKKFGSHVGSGAPFRFRACKQSSAGQVSAPKGAKLFRVVGEKFVPVEAQFNMVPDWTIYPDNEACIADFLVLDIDVKSKEIYCIDLLLDDPNGEQVQRSCWQLTRKSGVFKVVILDVLDR